MGGREQGRFPSPRGVVRRAALLALAAMLAAGCSRQRPPEPSTEGTPLGDIALVAAEDATSFTDLPGVPGFDQLTPTLQAAVLARANRAKCDCGCPGHSVNECLHQEERCDVALRLARGFVTDAEVLALNAPEAAGAAAPDDAGAAAPEEAAASAPDDAGASGPEAPADASGPESAAGASAPAAPETAGASAPASADPSAAAGPSGPEP